MAIIKIGAPLTGIRGTVGGITFSANGAGTYCKQWAKGPNPKTPKQMQQRAFVAALNDEWRGITPLQRTNWGLFALRGSQRLTNSLGEDYFISGFLWFTKCNTRLDRTGRAHIAPPPVQARPFAPTITTMRICEAGSNPDLCAGGAATASTEDGIWTADKAFDDSTAINNRWQTTAPNTTGWLEYALPATRVIRQYNIFAGDVAPNQNPKDWTFEYWDGGGWQVVDTITGESWPGGNWHNFYFDNDVTATRWRLNVSANQGHANHLYVVELEMKEAQVDASVVIYPEDEFADAPDYDLILHISGTTTTGRQVQYPNYYEILATQTPGRTATTFQDELEAVFGTVSANRAWFAHVYRQTTEGIRSAAAAVRAETE